MRDNDPAGELLAARGWSLSDLTSGIGSRVREPDVYATDNGAPVPLRFNPFLENDGRTGWYAGGSWRAPGRGGITLLRYDNEADPSTHSGGASPVFSWRTDFWSLGAEADVGDVVLLGQAMTGSTDDRAVAVLLDVDRFPRGVRARRLESRRVAAGDALRCVLDRAAAARASTTACASTATRSRSRSTGGRATGCA